MQKTTFVNREPLVRAMWVALSALAWGALLGGAWGLGGRQIAEPSLLYVALQSLFSAAVLGVLSSGRLQDLSLDEDSLPVCSELVQKCAGERSERWAQERSRIVYGRGRGLSPARYRALPAPARAVADVTRSDLASQLGLSFDRVAVLGVEVTNSAESSLGVIEPGYRYLEAATPGYIARFSVSASRIPSAGCRWMQRCE